VTGTATAANQLAAVRAVNGGSLRSSRLRRGIFQFPKELLLERRVFQHPVQDAIRLATLDVILERGSAGLGIERQAAQAAEPVDGGVLGLAARAGPWLHRAFDSHGILFLDAVHPQQGVVHIPAAKVIDHLVGKLPDMQVARAQNGAAFGLLVTNDRLNTPAQLDNGLLDADRPIMPLMFRPTPTFIGGVMLDKNANPRSNEA